MTAMHDTRGGADTALLGRIARHALDAGFHVVLEGILYADRFSHMIGHGRRSIAQFIGEGEDPHPARHRLRRLPTPQGQRHGAGRRRPPHPRPGLSPHQFPVPARDGQAGPGGPRHHRMRAAVPHRRFPQSRSHPMTQSKSTIAAISAQSPAQETDEVTGPVVVAVDVEDEE